MSVEASQVVTGIPSATCSPGVRVERHARDLWGSVEAGDVVLSLQGIREPYPTMAAAPAAYDQHFGLTTSRRRS